MYIVPGSLLLLWLFFHGVPMPKGSSRKDVMDQIQRAIDEGQPIDEDRIKSNDCTTARSYISFDTITLLNEATWVTDGESVLSVIQSQSVPKINARYINEIFGAAKNGIRERAWPHVMSGHLDLDTLQMTTTEVEIAGEPVKVHIFAMKVTPSMKNIVYNVHVIFTHTGDVPLAASYVFDHIEVLKSGGKRNATKDKSNEDETNCISTIASGLAKNVPGYSGKYKISNEDATEETRLISADSKEVTMIIDITDHNDYLVYKTDSNEEALRKYIRYERLYQMMKQEGGISKNKTLWDYLDFFASQCLQRIEQLSTLVEDKYLLEGPKKAAYDKQFLDEFFK
ncbi:hypothetical protein ACHAWF_014517 [Thalassiosira exigua]